MIGFFVNQALPSTVGGDTLRIYRLAKAGFPLGPSFNSVVLDRFVAFIGLLIIVAVGLPFLFPLVGDGPIQLGIVGTLVLATCTAMAVPTIDLIPLPSRLKRSVVGVGISGFAENARQILSKPFCIGPTLAISIGSQVAIAVAAFVMAVALGLALTLIEVLVLFPPVFLFSLLPISIGGWGVREGAMVTVLGLVAVEPVSAVALSVLFGGMTVVSSLPGGIIWLVHRSNSGQNDVPTSTIL